MKHDNVLVANLMRALQFRSERNTERGFSWVVNWFYGTFASHGTSPGRPLVILGTLYLFSILLGWYFCDYGHLTRMLPADGGVHPVYASEPTGRAVRLALLPLQSIVNPFGTLFDANRLILPDSWQFNVWLVIHGLFSDFMLVLSGLCIRRRFKGG